MSEERKTLLASLKETMVFFSERKTVGRMKTEHSIFIPSYLMLNQAEETEDFIRAARTINSRSEWGCPVSAEQATMMKISGVDFVFEFSTATDFEEIISFLNSKL